MYVSRMCLLFWNEYLARMFNQRRAESIGKVNRVAVSHSRGKVMVAAPIELRVW